MSVEPMLEAFTVALAVWGAVLGTLGTVLHAARFVFDRPRLRIRVNLGVIPRTTVDGVEMPTPFGFTPGTKAIVLEATKLGRGSLTVESAGFEARDGRTQFLVLANRPLPAKLGESDKVTFMIGGEALVEWLVKGKAPALRHAFCKTSDNKMRKQRIPQDVSAAVEGGVKARGG